jgi:tRNA threonylcarbamoyladenosine biosynthesis protein TsaE
MKSVPLASAPEMKGAPVLELYLANAEATTAFGDWLDARLVPGDVILLEGPIGAGKTHLARAIIRHRLNDSGAEVPSPTFTLVQTYGTPGVEVWHADLYRLAHPDEVEELGLLDAFDSQLCLVEWPDRLGRHTPGNAIHIRIDDAEEGRVLRLDAAQRPDLIRDLRQAWFARDV